MEAARLRGYDLSACSARQITPADFDRFDMILAMDNANVADLRRLAPTRCKQKIELLLEYGDRYHGQEVPDPYGKPAKDFEIALDMPISRGFPRSRFRSCAARLSCASATWRVSREPASKFGR